MNPIARLTPGRADRQIDRAYRLPSALLFALGLCLMLFGIVRAHEVQPLAPPALPACRMLDLTCAPESRVQPWLYNQPLTTTFPFAPYGDGKGWLQENPDLMAAVGRGELGMEALYDVPCVDGFVDVFPCRNVDLLAHLPPSLIGGQVNNDQWGWTDPQTGVEYALIGARDGMVVLDLSTPTAPRYVGKLATAGIASAWRDLKVYQDHVFVVADYNRNHGMQVYDLNGLRAINPGPVALQETAHYSGFANAHNIAINEASGFAYAVGSETCAGGLHMVDIHDPDQPQGVGCYSEDGYVHDTQCVIYHGPDLDYQGRELCFNSSVSQFTVVDVTDKTQPKRVGALTVDGTFYIHQGWLTADQHYLLFDDEMDETFGSNNTRTYVVDMRELDAPRLVDIYTSALPAIDHNLYISGTYAYEANYTTGLRVLDIQDIDRGKLHEAAFFDTVPENDLAVFNGAWTAYPYFRDGKVVISTLDRGVFIVKPTLAADVVFKRAGAETTFCRQAEPTAAAQSFTTTLDLIARNRYTQTIGLSLVSAPPSTVINFAPATIDMVTATTATSTMTLDLATLAPGIYTPTVQVSDPQGTPLDTFAFRFHLADGVSHAPTLTNGDLRLAYLGEITLAWQAVTGAASYGVEVAADPAFTQVIYRNTVATTRVTIDTQARSTPLVHDQDYYWRVHGINGCGSGTLSATGLIHTPTAVYLPLISKR